MMNSKTMIYDQTEKIYKPKWVLNINDISHLLYFNEKKSEYKKVNFVSKYINDRIKYLYNNDEAQLQELLDNGKIYLYLNRLDKKANEVVYSQIEKWEKSDKEYKFSKSVGDIKREVGLYNNLMARAEEIMYREIIYV